MDEKERASSSDAEPEEPARDLPSVLIDVNENLRRDLDEETKRRGESSSSGHGSASNRQQSVSERQIRHTGPDKEASARHITQNMRTHHPHENLRDTVFLRAEAIPEGQMKVRLDHGIAIMSLDRDQGKQSAFVARPHSLMVIQG